MKRIFIIATLLALFFLLCTIVCAEENIILTQNDTCENKCEVNLRTCESDCSRHNGPYDKWSYDDSAWCKKTCRKSYDNCLDRCDRKN